ncbi:MAG: SCO family protein [Rhodothermaeota bacterium MED-G16]|nr:MAG: SCO family protein [Rhodothermaeota bacterium MED-G16]
MKLHILLIFISSFISCNQEIKKLPVYGRNEITKKVLNGEIVIDTINHSIKNFSFYNQDSTKITRDTFDNAIYVADFFFTTCPTICPIMQNNLLLVYNEFSENKNVKYLSHTINPEYDNTKTLKKYAERLGVSSDRWHFVTGEIEDIYKIAKDSYMISALEDENEPGGFLHSGTFLLIDTNKNIRGIYDGTREVEMSRLMSDIKILLKSIS